MGATWLHGLQGNPLYHYAVEKGIMSPHATQEGKLMIVLYDAKQCSA
jgi:hypothetical protein